MTTTGSNFEISGNPKAGYEVIEIDSDKVPPAHPVTATPRTFRSVEPVLTAPRTLKTGLLTGSQYSVPALQPTSLSLMNSDIILAVFIRNQRVLLQHKQLSRGLLPTTLRTTPLFWEPPMA